MSNREIAEYKQTLHKSYIANQMILDGLLISLSMAGLGFIFSAFFNFSFEKYLSLGYMLFVFAVIAFLVCIFGVLWIFYLNGRYFELEAHACSENFKGENKKIDEIKCLAKSYDNVVRLAFIFGVLCSVFLFLYKINITPKEPIGCMKAVIINE